MGHVKVMMVKHDKREIEQLRGIFESDTYYEYAGCLEKGEHAVQKIADEKPDIVVVDEVVAGTDIMDIVESTSKNRNLKNVRFVLCSSKRHRNYPQSHSSALPGQYLFSFCHNMIYIFPQRRDLLVHIFDYNT